MDRTGGEEVLTTVLHDAYELEIAIGTIRSDAVFAITKAAKPDWKSEYHEQSFGSWSVFSPDGVARIDYDGKDFFLMVQKMSSTSPIVIWQGKISSSTAPDIGYFQTIGKLR